MARSPLILAALAAVALPGESPIAVRGIEVPGEYDAAEVSYAGGRRYTAKAPRDAETAVGQATELALLEELRPRVASGELPFGVVEVVGSAPLPEGGGRVVLTKLVAGNPLEVSELKPGLGLASQLGRAIAAIHELPTGLLERLGLPILTAADCRRFHQATVEAAGASGRVPPLLLSRWEAFLDDDELWDFDPVVIHGDLAAESVLEVDGQLHLITDWANVRVADPAEDLAWLVAAAPEEATASILKYYQEGRGGLADSQLVERAMFLSELALARWLLYGLRENDRDIVAEAQSMLSELAIQLS